MTDAFRYISADLPELLKILQASDVRELELEEEGMHVRLRRAPIVASASDVLTPVPVGDVSAGPVAVQIVAPMVGTFYRAAEPDSPPLAEEGTEVAETTIVGIIESLQVLNPVQAGHTGRVTRVLATDGQPVEYGQPIFEVTPSG